MSLSGPHLIVGLGNPGTDFAHTRHNAGFAVIDAFAEELGVNFWKLASNTLVAESTYQGEKILLAKPQAFMNLSGGPVKGLIARYDLALEDLLVIHDELDLPAGTVRLKQGGGHAGHNGLRSLHQSLGGDYTRLRVGIGRPPGRMPAHAFVLQRMSGQQLEDFEVTIARALPILRATLEEGLNSAMNIYHRNDQASETENDRAPERAPDDRAPDDRASDDRAPNDRVSDDRAPDQVPETESSHEFSND
jgi:PTH1 family peptidyl-tRNA hydrolase